MPVTRAPHAIRTPASAARSTIMLCRIVRRRPNPWPWGKAASTEAPRSQKRMPRNGRAPAASRSMPSEWAAARPSGMMPSPQALSIGGMEQSARVTSKPRWRAAMAAARPAGPPPITNTSVERGSVMRSNVYRAARQPQRFRPEAARIVGQVDHLANGCHKLLELPFRGHQRGRHFQHHEIVAADLSENVLVAEQAHDQHLAEHGRMNVPESLERHAQAKLARRGEFNR